MPALDLAPVASSLRSLPAAHGVVPIAAWLAIASLAASQQDPAAAAESRFLALLVAGVLAAIGALSARRPAPELGWTAVLATAAAWILFQGAPRGAAVGVLLVLGLAAALVRALPDLRPFPVAGGAAPLEPAVTMPAAFGLQLLLRNDLLLPPLLDARTLVSVLVLPLLAGASMSLLARRFDPRQVLLAGGAAVVLAGGWNVTVTLGLVALAAGTLLADRDQPAAARALAGAALAVMPLWKLTAGALLALVGLGCFLSSRAVRGWAALLLVPAALGGAILAAPGADWTAAGELWLRGLVVLPAALLSVLATRSQAERQLLILGLAAAAALAAAAGEPAAGFALAALGVPVAGRGKPSRTADTSDRSLGSTAATDLQLAWCGLVLLGTTALACYPWIRSDPLADLLALLGLPGLSRPAPYLAFFALAALLAAAARLLDRLADGSGIHSQGAGLAMLILVGLALIHGAAPTTVLVDSYGSIALDERRRGWRQAFPEQSLEALVLDTSLVHGVRLKPGTEIAAVKLRDAGDNVLETWMLRAGYDTAEWAAGRRDVVERPGFVAPPPWISLVAPDGSFFAQRFRTHFVAGERHTAAAVTVHLATHLPAEVGLVIYRVELRR